MVLLDYIICKKFEETSYKQFFSSLIKLFLLICFATIIYQCINFLLQLKYPSSKYLDHYVWWGHYSLHFILKNFIYTYHQSIFNNSELYFYKLSELTFACIILLVIYYLLFKIRGKDKLFFVFWIMLFFVSPLLLSLLLGSPTPLRALQALPYLMGISWVFILVAFNSKTIMSGLSVLATFIIIYQTQQIVLIFTSDYLRYQEDVFTANAIAYKIEELNLKKTSSPTIIFTGRISRKQNSRNIKMETLGASFFEWDNGNPRRILALFKDLGYDYSLANDDDIKKGMMLQKTMSVWPNKGSIIRNNNIIVVKLSEQ